MNALQEKIARAFQLIEDGYFLRAETIADRILKSKEADGQIQALHIKALALYKSEHLKKSFDVFQRLLKIQPDHEEGLYYTAVLFAEEGLFLAAQKFTDQLLLKEPDHLPYLELSAQVAFFLDQREKALGFYDRIIQLQPDHLAVLFERADMLRKLHQFVESNSAYQEILDMEKDNEDIKVVVYNNIGWNYS
ncbi:MAG: hypothetical protein AAF242_17380, partial [Bacteroidota bacterium]